MIETIAFIFGAIVGGIISNYSFGKPKNLVNEVLEIIIFYLIAIILSNRFRTLNLLVFTIIGLISSIAARGISTKFNYVSAELKKKTKVSRYGLLVGLFNALKRRGFEKDEIANIAKEVGFKETEIKEVIK